jgi:predicted DNA-binding transcriptional regulator AlpA
MDTPVANGDPTLATLIPEGVSLAHIIALFQDAYPVNGVQLLRARLGALGAIYPANLAPPELAEFIKYMLRALKSAGIRDPAAMLAYGVRREAEAAAAKLGSLAAIGDIAAERKSAEREPVALKNKSSKTYESSLPQPVDLTRTTENPFDGREHDGRVFRDRRERNFFIGRLSPRQKEEWLRDHPDRWQTREEFLRDLQARARTDVAAEPTEPPSTPLASEVPTGSESNGLLLVPGEDEPQPHKSATNTAPPTIATPEATVPATAAAGDEINIGGRRFVSEPRVAEMLGHSPRTLQRWRMEGKGPPSTKIGRKTFYELNELQKWMDREKSR